MQLTLLSIVNCVFLNVTFSGQTSFVPEFAQMCGKLMGRFWEYLGSFFSLLAVTGAAVVYWVLMSNFLYNSITYIYGKFRLNVRKCLHFIWKCICDFTGLAITNKEFTFLMAVFKTNNLK